MQINFLNFFLRPEEVPIKEEENEANDSSLENNIDKPAEEKGEINSEKESSENQERPPIVDDIPPQASPPPQEESREEGPKVIELDKDRGNEVASDGGKEEAPDGGKKEAPKEDGEKNKFDDFEVPAIVSREPPPQDEPHVYSSIWPDSLYSHSPPELAVFAQVFLWGG